jgi:hypothetical protein
MVLTEMGKATCTVMSLSVADRGIQPITSTEGLHWHDRIADPARRRIRPGTTQLAALPEDRGG